MQTTPLFLCGMIAALLILLALSRFILDLSSPVGSSLRQVPIYSKDVSSPFETAVDYPPLSLNKVVLVTGAAGFIGSHVSEWLLRRGDRVVVVDEMNDHYDIRIKHSNLNMLIELGGANLTVYKGDVCDQAFITAVFEKERPTHICHLAARAGVRPSIQNPFVYVHSNVEGTTRMLELARVYNVVNFVFASSSSVYGRSKLVVLSESDFTDSPISPYAATKKST